MTSFSDRESILDELFWYSWFCLAEIEPCGFEAFREHELGSDECEFGESDEIGQTLRECGFSLVLDKVVNKLQGRFI